MHIGLAPPGRTVSSGGNVGKFLRMSGGDAIVELKDGRRVMWSEYTEVELLSDEEEIQENILPALEAELLRLERFAIGKYAPLGLVAETPCIELPKQFHAMFIRGALGVQPSDAILCRRCISSLCIKADHMFWGTRSDCQRDMCLRGLAKPAGKQVTAATIALRIVKLRARITRVNNKLSK